MCYLSCLACIYKFPFSRFVLECLTFELFIEQVICELAKSPTVIGKEIMDENPAMHGQCTRSELNETAGLSQSNTGKGSCCNEEGNESGPRKHGETGCGGGGDRRHGSKTCDGMRNGSSSGEVTNSQCYDQDCSECHIRRRDPTPAELTMYLHALSYKVSESNVSGALHSPKR